MQRLQNVISQNLSLFFFCRKPNQIVEKRTVSQSASISTASAEEIKIQFLFQDPNSILGALNALQVIGKPPNNSKVCSTLLQNKTDDELNRRFHSFSILSQARAKHNLRLRKNKASKKLSNACLTADEALQFFFSYLNDLRPSGKSSNICARIRFDFGYHVTLPKFIEFNPKSKANLIAITYNAICFGKWKL